MGSEQLFSESVQLEIIFLLHYCQDWPSAEGFLSQQNSFSVYSFFHIKAERWDIKKKKKIYNILAYALKLDVPVKKDIANFNYLKSFSYNSLHSVKAGVQLGGLSL